MERILIVGWNLMIVLLRSLGKILLVFIKFIIELKIWKRKASEVTIVKVPIC